jgi:hypothetical protein
MTSCEQGKYSLSSARGSSISALRAARQWYPHSPSDLMLNAPPTLVKVGGGESTSGASVGSCAGVAPEVIVDECATVCVTGVLGRAPDEKHREVGG